MTFTDPTPPGAPQPEIPAEPGSPAPEIQPADTPDEMPPLEPGGGDDHDSRPHDGR